MPRGMQPIGLDVIVTHRSEERDELVTLLGREATAAQKARFLARYDGRTATVEQIVQATWIGLAWFRCLTPAGNYRTRDLIRDYVETYGTPPVAAD